MTPLATAPDQPEPLAQWLERSLHDTAGQDPLGFNTISLDRILPQLMPGVLQLSERARYFSIYSWMLWEFARRKRPATSDELDRFIRRREFELCLAIKLCTHCYGEAAIGSRRAGPRVTAGDDPFMRGGQSVDTPKGGFGLYYRSPLQDLGAVVRAGTPLGEEGETTPIEILRPGDVRAIAAAEAFHDAIKETIYYDHYERNNEPIPRSVMQNLAESACLCRLPFRTAERDAVRRLLFEPANDITSVVEACRTRRRGFALFLSLVAENPRVAADTGEFWQGLISSFEDNPHATGPRADTVASWAALAMKECMQETMCSVWTEFCRKGVQQQGLEGMTQDQLRGMIHQLAHADQALAGIELSLSSDEPAQATHDRLAAAAAELDWNTVRAWTAQQNTAASGMAAMLILADRVPAPGSVHPLWHEIARRGSEHQDGLLAIVGLLRNRLHTASTVGELMNWVVRRFIMGPHEVIAYSKLPNATFRFSWDEAGHLRFFTPGGGGLGRFSPSDDRRAAMATLSADLGYWGWDQEVPRLTDDGRRFVATVFG